MPCRNTVSREASWRTVCIEIRERGAGSVKKKKVTHQNSTCRWPVRTAIPKWLQGTGRNAIECKCRSAGECSKNCRNQSLLWYSNRDVSTAHSPAMEWRTRGEELHKSNDCYCDDVELAVIIRKCNGTGLRSQWIMFSRRRSRRHWTSE